MVCATPTEDAAMASQGFETKSVLMEACMLVSIQTPEADVERLLAAVRRLTPLVIGHYDSNAFQSAGGIEHYRPLEGAAAGAESGVRRRPGVVEISFQLPSEQALLVEVVEAIFQAHAYQEPVIVVREVLASRSKGLDDKDNPHRWWNSTSDWKKRAVPHE
jgi:hypothetical protein